MGKGKRIIASYAVATKYPCLLMQSVFINTVFVPLVLQKFKRWTFILLFSAKAFNDISCPKLKIKHNLKKELVEL